MTTIDAYMEQLAEDMAEELHPELAAYMQPSGLLPSFLNHPLVQMVHCVPGQANRQFESKKARLAKAQTCTERLWIYERPYRLPMVVHWWETGELVEPELAPVLAAAWKDMEGDDTVDSPFIRTVLDIFRQVAFFTDSEETGWTRQSCSWQVYRGGPPNGIAWSLKMHVAEFFANRFSDDEGELHMATCPQGAALAFLTARGEFEVVVDPADLIDVRRLS